MTAVAIEEWQLAGPVYTRRMQRALGFVGDDVTTIFKGLQLDIGAPPQIVAEPVCGTDAFGADPGNAGEVLAARQVSDPVRLRSGWINGIKKWQVRYE
jgi:hypothetical protein